MNSGESVSQPDLAELSDVGCPLCGFLPKTGRGAAWHLAGHLFGTHTTGEAQLEAMQE